MPFVAPPGIRMVRIDRASGKRVFGTFPTTEDPKSSVIWEAFQPETEPRRSFRRERCRAGADGAEADGSRATRPRDSAASRAAALASAAPHPGRQPATSCKAQGGIY